MLGEDFIKVPRLSRIVYGGLFYNYPIEILNTLTNLGAVESFLILLSFVRWKLWPHRVEENFEQWVTNRFGRRLYLRFFKTYTEKVWGIPCDQIRASGRHSESRAFRSGPRCATPWSEPVTSSR